MHTISQWIMHHSETSGNHRSKASSCLIKMQQIKAWSPKHLTSSLPAVLTSLKLLNRHTISPRQSGQTSQMKPNHQCCGINPWGLDSSDHWASRGNLALSCSSIWWVPASLGQWPHLSKLQGQHLQISLCSILSSPLCRVSVGLSSISFLTLFIFGCTGSLLLLVGFL